MLFRQLIHDDLGCASYLIGDHGAGVAAVVDPRFEIDEYLELARFIERRASSTCSRRTTTPTTSRATAGSRRRRARRSTSTAEAAPGLRRTSRSTTAGSCELGSLTRARDPHARPPPRAHRLRADRHRARRGAVGGPHRRHAVRRRRRTPRPGGRPHRGSTRHLRQPARRSCWRSPPETEVWPGHLGGSLCGGPGMDLKVSSTIGYELRHNDAVRRGRTSDRFVERATAKLPPQPPNFQAIVDINRGPLLTAGVEVMPLAPRQVEQKRSPRERCSSTSAPTSSSDEAHIPGSVCITMLHAGFGTKLAWVVEPRPGDRADRPRRRRRARAPQRSPSPSACATSAASWPAA